MNDDETSLDAERADEKGAGDPGRAVRWALVPALFAAVGYALLPLQSWDYWWHLTMGRIVEATGEVPSEALFLYTMQADAPSYVQPWLAQWMLYVVHEGLGLQANLALRGLVVAGVFGATTGWAIRRARDPVASGLLGVAGLLVAFPFLDVRTNLFVLPLFVATIACVRGVHVGRFSRHVLWALIPVAVLWANLHGSFFLPAVVCGLYAAAGLWERWRAGEGDSPDRPVGALALAALAALLAPLVNPRGPELYGYVYTLATDPMVQRAVTEWQMTTPFFPSFAGPVFYLLVVAAGLLLWERRDEVDPSDLALVAAFGLLAVGQARGLIWFGLVVPVALAPYLEGGRSLASWPRAGWSGVAAVGLVAVAIQPCWPWWPSVAAGYRAVPVRTEAPYRGAVPEEAPVEAVRVLRGMENLPRLFHDERHAGFLLYHLLEATPQRLVFVDQRVELPPLETWRAYGEASRGERWRPIFRMYGVGAALVHRERQAGLLEALDEADAWNRAVDGTETVLFAGPRSSAVGQLGDRLLE